MPVSGLQKGGSCPMRLFRKRITTRIKNQPPLAFIPGDAEKSSVLKATASTIYVLSQIIVWKKVKREGETPPPISVMMAFSMQKIKAPVITGNLVFTDESSCYYFQHPVWFSLPFNLFSWCHWALFECVCVCIWKRNKSTSVTLFLSLLYTCIYIRSNLYVREPFVL